MSDLYDTPRPLVRVRFEPQGIEVHAPKGRILLAIARQAGVHVEAPCGGQGWCGRCRVVASGALSEHAPDELRLLSPDDLASGVRLACRAKVLGDVVVRPWGETAPTRIVERSADIVLDVEPPEERGLSCEDICFGAAVDIGTTTLAVALLDLRTGEKRAGASALNPQVAFGHDVMSRVGRAMQGGGEELRQAVLREIERLLLDTLRQQGADARLLAEVSLAGNTAMAHLLLGIDPSPLAAAPYEGAFVEAANMSGAELGLTSLPDARVYMLPAISAFVGGDIVAGLLATALPDRETPTLLVDLGTNGEVVLRTAAGLFASSTAAGPALEGASISQGMRAEPGAIERVESRDGRLELAVIGDASPRGLCGSGLLDLVAVMLEAGVLDATGRLRPAGVFADRIEDAGSGRRFRVDDDGVVWLTQQDVRQVQLAKGAVFAGISLLLEEAGLAEDDIEEVVIAGGFGLHVRPAALARIGLIPQLWADRVSFAGNTSLAGARAGLVNSAIRAKAEAYARAVATVPLAAHPSFQQRFIASMGFPA